MCVSTMLYSSLSCYSLLFSSSLALTTSTLLLFSLWSGLFQTLLWFLYCALTYKNEYSSSYTCMKMSRNFAKVFFSFFKWKLQAIPWDQLWALFHTPAFTSPYAHLLEPVESKHLEKSFLSILLSILGLLRCFTYRQSQLLAEGLRSHFTW